MKKSLTAALSAALVVGAASTTFAAANPFSDVPADHWAYEAVAQLTADGVIDGYGDASFRGQQQITRFEMAQMIAKAMAKGANSAAVDKLAAEFAEELNALGVRVANLEKKIDNVKFYGELRMQQTSTRTKTKATGDKTTKNVCRSELHLKSDAIVNKNWTAKATIIYRQSSLKTAANATLNRVGAMEMQGKYGNTVIDLGRYYVTEPITEGLLWDDANTGIQITTGKKLQVTVAANRFNNDWFWIENDQSGQSAGAADMLGGNVMYNGKNFNIGAAYYHLANSDVLLNLYNGKDKADIWAIGGGVNFAKHFRLFATYAGNSKYDSAATTKPKQGKQDKLYAVQLNYKGASLGKPGSWGAWLAYKHLGSAVATEQSPNLWSLTGEKGWEIGGTYTFAKNIRLHIGYFDGKKIQGDQDVHRFFSRLRFFF